MTQSDGSVPCVGALTYDETGRLLVIQRANEPGRGLWSLPGGRVEPGEDDAAALRREFLERLDASIEVAGLISHVNHPYEHYTVELFLYRCHLGEGELSCRGVAEYAWVTSREFDEHEFTPADEESMSRLLGE